MKMIKIIAVFFVGIALLFGSVANASMPCCMGLNDNTAMHMMEGADDTASPCHVNSNADKVPLSTMDCDDCNCVHCVTYSMISSHISTSYMSIVITHSMASADMHSLQLNEIFQPPKLIS